MKAKALFLGAAIALAAALPATAQDHSAHQGHGAETPAGESASSKTYAEANARMHAGMDIEFSGDADVDFARGMIAHHQGAIDMARVELEFGKDPALRKLAEEVIAAQEGEIRMMQEWLEKNAK